MKLFYALVILIAFQHCSFDNKSGIWKNKNTITNIKNDTFNEFELLSSSDQPFNEIINVNKNFKFILDKPTSNFIWSDSFFDKSNNLKNFKLNDQAKIIFKSKKLTKYKINDYILFENDQLIVSDERGNLIIFSINQNRIISKFNFYSKRHKKIKKKLNLIIEKNTIYISDNIGYLYAYDLINNKILWAKNYKIPFRSNLKIFENKLIASTENNNLYFFNKNTGDNLKLIPTEETLVKNNFINNLSLSDKTLFFLNTYGSLYSVDAKSMKIRWFINLNRSSNLNTSNLFLGKEIINQKDKIIVSSNNFTYIINSNTGAINYKKNFSMRIKPIILNDVLFTITKNNLILSVDLTNGNILYSHNINQQVSEFLNIKKKKVEYKNFIIANNNIYIFLTNSYILKYEISGNLKEVLKLTASINSLPIIINDSILYLDKKNKLIILD